MVPNNPKRCSCPMCLYGVPQHCTVKQPIKLLTPELLKALAAVLNSMDEKDEDDQ